MRRTPFALRGGTVAIGLALSLVACSAGDTDSGGTTLPDAVPASSSSVPSGEPVGDGEADLGPLTPPEVVRVSSSSIPDASRGGNDSATTAGMAAEESAMDGALVADELMVSSYMPMWTVISEIVVADSMPALPTDAVGYVHRSGTGVSESVATTLATAFGVDPAPMERPREYMVEWAFGPDDGSAPSLTIDAYPTHNWWYSSGWGGWSDDEEAPACTETVTADGEITVDCPEWEPKPPVGVPTANEAEARAREFIRAAGFDDSVLTFEVFADEWFAAVYATEPLISGLDGVSATEWSFGFGAEGRLDYAGGSFGMPEAVGPYPLVGVDVAVERLRAMYTADGWYGMGEGAVDMPAEATNAVDDAGSDEATVLEMVEPEAMPIDGALDEPAPEPLPAPEPNVDADIDDIADDSWVEPTEPTEITLTLVDVVADVWWTEDVDGNVWLLPAYRFIGDDGNWYTVPAVTDEYMVETPTYDEPVPSREEPAVSSGAAPSTGSVGAPSEELVELLAPIDLSDVDDAVLAALEQIINGDLAVDEQLFADTAAEFGVEMRVVERDGEPLMVTEDYRTDRINVVVADGVVVAINGIG